MVVSKAGFGVVDVDFPESFESWEELVLEHYSVFKVRRVAQVLSSQLEPLDENTALLKELARPCGDVLQKLEASK